MTLSLRVAPEKEAAFNEFYHHRYIAKLLAVVPESVTARRFAAHGIASSLKWFTACNSEGHLLARASQPYALSWAG